MAPRLGTLVAGLLCIVASAADAGDDVVIADTTPTGQLAQISSAETTPAQITPGQVALATTASPARSSEVFSGVQGTLFVEDALSGWTLRPVLVPFPASTPTWQNRTSVDIRYIIELAPNLTATVSDRLNMFEQSDFDFGSRGTFTNDFREGYVAEQLAPNFFVEAGRINVTNGVALGFNPTDFFKTRTLIDQVSEDPSVLRYDRLGTVMLRWEYLANNFTLSFSAAPKLTTPSPTVYNLEPGFDPGLDRTNADDRFLITASYDFGHDWKPQVLLFRDDNENRIGANLSHGFGKSIIAYAEWAGGNQLSLAQAAEDFGRDTGGLPAGAPDLLVGSQGEAFRNDVAVGASWTPLPEVTVNLEYHYHQAGFSRADWNGFFNLGTASPLAAAELWYVRSYAADQQEPTTRQEIFARATWTNAFVRNLQLNALGFFDVYDGSVVSQVSAQYFLTDHWTVGVYGGGSFGGSRSEYGSLPQSYNGILQLVAYY